MKKINQTYEEFLKEAKRKINQRGTLIIPEQQFKDIYGEGYLKTMREFEKNGNGNIFIKFNDGIYSFSLIFDAIKGYQLVLENFDFDENYVKKLTTKDFLKLRKEAEFAKVNVQAIERLLETQEMRLLLNE